MIKSKPKWWTPYWIILVIVTIIIGLTLPLFQNIPIETAVLFLILTLLAEALAYIMRVKQSLALNRIIYIIFIGIPVGSTLWLTLLLTHSFGLGTNQNLPLIISSVIVCFAVGGVIGDTIGKLRKYKGPGQYSP